MKKFLLPVLFFLLVLKGESQIMAILQSPPGGYMYKPQLWTMVLTNTGNTAMHLHIEVTLHAVSNSQQVLSGVTRTFLLQPGTTQITANDLMPVQYHIQASSYNVDANPLGLLPIGSFEACYHFFKHASDVVEQVGEHCQEIIVEPLSPPQLVYPYDATAIEERHPQFSWLPPVPAQGFTNLSYDLTLVEINGSQSPADAIQQNVPVYQAVQISSNSLLYPLSAPSLELQKRYAWRVEARSGEAAVGTSETWQFEIKQFGVFQTGGVAVQPYVQLKKEPEAAYAIVSGLLRFSYVNETQDSLWQLKVYDLSSEGRNEFSLPMDSIPLKRGMNLVQYDVRESGFFVHKHLYLLEVQNSRKEVWRMRFEYRNPDENLNQNN